MLATVRRLAMPGLFCSLLLSPLAFAQNPRVTVTRAVRHAISRPLRDITPVTPFSSRTEKERPPKPIPVPPQVQQRDPVLQTTPGSSLTVATAASFEGLGVSGGYTPDAAPPDTNGSAGTTQYVQWVNEDFAIWDKSSGARLYGPAAGNTLWHDLGGACATYNDGDPIVLFDKAAKRWIFTQFVVSAGSPYHQCVAVSRTDDATGAFSLYDFTYSNFNDYPKVGVWSDGYYVTFNMFKQKGFQYFFQGTMACAWDRAKMLAGQAATQQCVQLSSSFGGLLPADIDGSTAPPAGAPEYFLNFGSNSLNLWKFHVDWANSANSTFTGPTNIPVAAFSAACSGGGTCIPQPGTSQKLDSLADRLMYRLAYRNFGDHDTLLVNHSVTAGSSVGVRWYELRNPSTSPSIYQQGTFAPSSDYRWMGSIAMDKTGDIALGYSISNASTIKPSISYTGRTSTDALGTMQAETSLNTGGGSQLSNLSRWGDYSSLSVDPSDDCTFWYTTEFLQANGTFNWSTHISSFSFPGCTGATTTQPPSAPTGLTATAGDSQVTLGWNASTGASSYNVYRATTSGVETSYATGITSTSFVDSAVTNGITYFYKVTASNANGESGLSAEASATPNPPPPPPTCSAFSLAGSPSSITLTRGSSGTSNIAVVGGSDGCSYNFTVAVSGGLRGVSASVSPASASGASAATTLTVSVSGKPQTGTAVATVTATDSQGHTASVPVSITEQ